MLCLVSSLSLLFTLFSLHCTFISLYDCHSILIVFHFVVVVVVVAVGLLAHNLNFSNAAAFATSFPLLTTPPRRHLPLWSALCRRELLGRHCMPKSSLHLLLVLIFTFNWQNRIDSQRWLPTATPTATPLAAAAVKADDVAVWGIRLNFIWRRQRRGLRRRSASSNMSSPSAIYRSGGAGSCACSLKIVIISNESCRANQMSSSRALQTVTKLGISRLIWPQFAQLRLQLQLCKLPFSLIGLKLKAETEMTMWDETKTRARPCRTRGNNNNNGTAITRHGTDSESCI